MNYKDVGAAQEKWVSLLDSVTPRSAEQSVPKQTGLYSRSEEKAGLRLSESPVLLQSFQLQRAQEVKQVLLLRRGKEAVMEDHPVGFGTVARVLIDGTDQVTGAAIMEEVHPLPQAP